MGVGGPRGFSFNSNQKRPSVFTAVTKSAKLTGFLT